MVTNGSHNFYNLVVLGIYGSCKYILLYMIVFIAHCSNKVHMFVSKFFLLFVY